MKIVSLSTHPATYSCVPYLVLGTWNRLEDVNTLVDVGPDGYILDQIGQINTGVGKRPVERIILTHNHFDHGGGVGTVKSRFKAEVLAWAPGPHVDRLLQDGEELRLGDAFFEVIHMPGHSFDSICLFNRAEGVLFSGDSPLRIQSLGGSYLAEFLRVLERLVGLPVTTILSGHDPAITGDTAAILRRTWETVRACTLVNAPAISPPAHGAGA